jgi:hypothetical protein
MNTIGNSGAAVLIIAALLRFIEEIDEKRKRDYIAVSTSLMLFWFAYGVLCFLCYLRRNDG